MGPEIIRKQEIIAVYLHTRFIRTPSPNLRFVTAECRNHLFFLAAPTTSFLQCPYRYIFVFQFDTVRDIKEKLCYIPTGRGDPAGEDEYELPDGNTVTLDAECRSKAAEVRIQPIKTQQKYTHTRWVSIFYVTTTRKPSNVFV